MNVTVDELIAEIGRLHIRVMALETQLAAVKAENATLTAKPTDPKV